MGNAKKTDWYGYSIKGVGNRSGNRLECRQESDHAGPFRFILRVAGSIFVYSYFCLYVGMGLN